MSLFEDDIPAAEPEAELELPPIQGTEKQYNWSTAVRKKKLLAIREFLASCQAYADRMLLTNPEKAAECQQSITATTARFEALCTETAARFWLDRRDQSVQQLLDGEEPPKSYTWRDNERVEK